MSSGKQTLTGISLTDDQAEIFAKFKSELKIPATGIPQDSGIRDDTTLFRFISGKKWDIKVAKAQYEAMVKWRAKFEVETIEEWGKKNQKKVDLIESMYPSRVYSYDKYGRPVVVQRMGLIPATKFRERVDIADWKKYHILVFERLAQLCRDQTKKLKKPVYNVAVIVDSEGLSFNHRAFFQFFKSNSETDKQNYPEFLHTVTVINAPWVLPTLYKLVKGFIDPATREKIRFFTDGYEERLLSLMDEKEIPTRYGGKNEKKLPYPDFLEKADEKKANVPARRSWSIKGECKEGSGKFIWSFISEGGYDINFNVYWTPTGGEKKTVQKSEKITKNEGEYEAKTHGTLELEFDNTFSYLTSKDISYAFEYQPFGGSPKEVMPTVQIDASKKGD